MRNLHDLDSQPGQDEKRHDREEDGPQDGGFDHVVIQRKLAVCPSHVLYDCTPVWPSAHPRQTPSG